jgi:hypothetical protein
MPQPFLAMITPLATGPVDPGYNPPGVGPGLPGGPPYPSQGPGFPTHPIAPGGPPLGIWGGAPLPWPTPPIHYPPQQPPYPSQGPGFPTHPIAGLPGSPQPQPPYVDNTLPPYIDNSLPIVPPQQPVVSPEGSAYIVAYMPKSDGSGYERITFTVEIPDRPPPTEPAPKPA